MRFVTRRDVEFYLKTRYSADPIVRALLEISLQIMQERGVDWLENNPPERPSA
jgi:hypothetical protein